jgi:hypothetical protein
MEFKAGDYNLRQYALLTDDGYFFGPLEPTKYLVSVEKEVWQFNFTIPADKAFKQKEGTIYWLSVEILNDYHLFGWQSAAFNQRWNDDAVWAVTPPGGSSSWAPLKYLVGDPPNPLYPYPGQSMDLAFVTTPIPGTVLLLGTGLLGLAALGRRFRK